MLRNVLKVSFGLTTLTDVNSHPHRVLEQILYSAIALRDDVLLEDFKSFELYVHDALDDEDLINKNSCLESFKANFVCLDVRQSVLAGKLNEVTLTDEQALIAKETVFPFNLLANHRAHGFYQDFTDVHKVFWHKDFCSKEDVVLSLITGRVHYDNPVHYLNYENIDSRILLNPFIAALNTINRKSANQPIDDALELKRISHYNKENAWHINLAILANEMLEKISIPEYGYEKHRAMYLNLAEELSKGISPESYIHPDVRSYLEKIRQAKNIKHIEDLLYSDHCPVKSQSVLSGIYSSDTERNMHEISKGNTAAENLQVIASRAYHYHEVFQIIESHAQRVYENEDKVILNSELDSCYKLANGVRRIFDDHGIGFIIGGFNAPSQYLAKACLKGNKSLLYRTLPLSTLKEMAQSEEMSSTDGEIMMDRIRGKHLICKPVFRETETDTLAGVLAELIKRHPQLMDSKELASLLGDEEPVAPELEGRILKMLTKQMIQDSQEHITASSQQEADMSFLSSNMRL